MKQAVVSVYFLTYLRAGSFSGKRPRLEWFILKKGKAGLAPLKNFNTQHDFHDSKLTWTKNACIDLIIVCFDLYHQFIILFVFKKQWDLYNCILAKIYREDLWPPLESRLLFNMDERDGSI